MLAGSNISPQTTQAWKGLKGFRSEEEYLKQRPECDINGIDSISADQVRISVANPEWAEQSANIMGSLLGFSGRVSERWNQILPESESHSENKCFTFKEKRSNRQGDIRMAAWETILRNWFWRKTDIHYLWSPMIRKKHDITTYKSGRIIQLYWDKAAIWPLVPSQHRWYKGYQLLRDQPQNKGGKDFLSSTLVKNSWSLENGRKGALEERYEAIQHR